MATNDTTHFGFTRVGSGENISKKSYAATDLDKVVLDNLMYAALTHTHSGSPALGDPTDAPTMTIFHTDGALPSSTTLYYRVSFLDVYGLETAGSPEGSVQTPDPIDTPDAPVVNATSAGGTLGMGVYSYAITATDAYGGQTSVSVATSQAITAGSTNKITLSLPDLDVDATSFNVWRTKPGQNGLYYIGSTTSTTFVDTGLVEDQTVTAPSVNTTMSTNSVVVTVPLAFIPEGCTGWNIYRTDQSGIYGGSALVHSVVETTDPTGTQLVTNFTDTGGSLLAGYPREISSTAPEGSVIALDNVVGSLPLSATPRGAQSWSVTAGGAVSNKVVSITEILQDVQPALVSAYFQTPPTENGVVVAIALTDSAANSVTLNCATDGGSPAGYYALKYPLIISNVIEAETGTLANNAVIDTELAANNNQAVALTANGDSVALTLGTLEAGNYGCTVRMRVDEFDTAMTGADLTVTVRRDDTHAVLGSATFNLQSTNPSDPTSAVTDFIYRDLTGPTFTAPGGVNVVVTVAKATASTQAYEIDYVRFDAAVPTLVAGLVTMSTSVSGGTTAASDVAVHLRY